jgi:hypothetical protein
VYQEKENPQKGLLIWFEYLNACIRVVTVNWIKLGNPKIWKALNASQEEEGKKKKEKRKADGWIKSMGVVIVGFDGGEE